MNNISRGFTLVELMVTIAVASVLMGIAAPSFSEMMKNSRLATEANDLVADLAFARSESAKRGRRVTICASSDRINCDPGPAWVGPRIVFVETGSYGTVDSGEETLRSSEGTATKHIVITASGFSMASASAIDYLQYRATGATNSDTAGEFKVCDDRTGNFGRIIAVSQLGRSSLKSTTGTCP